MVDEELEYDDIDDDKPWWPDEDDDDLIDGVGFADEGSALRSTHGTRCISRGCRKPVGERDLFCRHCGHELNPRIFPCPTCGDEEVLTSFDVYKGYQCNRCSDRAEGPGHGRHYY